MMKYKNTLIVGALVLTCTAKIKAQPITNDGAIFSIKDGSEISITTDFINKGNLINEGNIFLEGNWTNVGSYVGENGELLLVGNSDQFISNNAQELSSLHITGSGDKIVVDDLTLTSQLQFGSGKLRVNEDVRLLLTPEVEIVGVTEDSYIVGQLYRQGSGQLFYPIGSESEYLPVTLSEVDGIDPIVGFEALSASPVQTPGVGLSTVSENRFWRMTKEPGYYSGSITLPFGNESFVADNSRVVVAQANGDEAPFYSIGAVSTADELVTSQGLAIGPFFAVAYTTEEFVLPPIKVVNALTPLQDGKHDFLRMENIELYENNHVEIFNRNGVKVFSITDYNNRDRVFTGMGNQNGGQELSDGTYFYTIRKGNKHVMSGFLVLKR